MPRPKGSKNKKTVNKNIFRRIFGKYYLTDEDKFINELSEGYLRWKKIGNAEFAGIYKMLINKYTQPE